MDTEIYNRFSVPNYEIIRCCLLTLLDSLLLLVSCCGTLAVANFSTFTIKRPFCGWCRYCYWYPLSCWNICWRSSYWCPCSCWRCLMPVSDVSTVEADPAVADVPVIASVPAVSGVFAFIAWRPCYCGLPYFYKRLSCCWPQRSY